jgi:uncharacterized protein YukE
MVSDGSGEVREEIHVTPDALLGFVGRLRGFAAELRQASAATGWNTCWVSANLGGAGASFDRAWLLWSVALDQLAVALERHAAAVAAAATDYRHTDARAVPLPLGP